MKKMIYAHEPVAMLYNLWY